MDTSVYQTAQTQRNVNIPPKAVNPSCFGNIEDVTHSVISSASTVERIVNRLCGSVPQDPVPGESTLTAEVPPLFDTADRQARAIRAAVQRIDACMKHLESQLP